MTEIAVGDRYQDCAELIEALLCEFGVYGYPSDMDLHIREFNSWSTQAPSWPSLLRRYITYRRSSGIYERFALLRSIGPNTFAHPGFELNSLFDESELEVFEPAFGGGFSASFSSTDLLGELLLSWHRCLEPSRRILSFRRLVRTAVNYNRYEVMHKVRSAYRDEVDPEVRIAYERELSTEDPSRVIEGRGVIPGR